MFAGLLGLHPQPLSEPRCLLQHPTKLHIGPKKKLVFINHHLLSTCKGDSGNINPSPDAVSVTAL